MGSERLSDNELVTSRKSGEFSLVGSADLLDLEKTKNTGFADFTAGVWDGAVSNSVKAIKQVAGSSDNSESHKAPESKSASNLAGQIVGSLVPYAAVFAVTKGGSNLIFGKMEAPQLGRIVAENAVSGFVLGSLLTPSELKPGESLLSSRLESGSKDAAVFASMALSSSYLSSALPASLRGAVLSRLGIGAGSGAVGGFVDAEFRTGGNASGSDLLASMAGYAAFGTLMEGGGLAAKKLFSGVPSSSPREFSQRADSSSEQWGAAQALAKRDSSMVVINEFGGWHDKLSQAIYTAEPGKTIIVADKAWLQAGEIIRRGANRPDINLVFDEALAKASAERIPSAAAPERRLINGSALGQLVESEVARTGKDPGEALVEALRRDRVVMIGEFHTPDNPHRELGAKLMPKLADAGATHLAIEHSADFQGKVFLPSGEVDRSQFTSIMAQWEYLRMLQNARKAGIEVVPVDSRESDLEPIRQALKPQLEGLSAPNKGALTTAATLDQRNRDMAANINKILEDPKAKVVFWVGNYHLNTTQLPGEGPQVAKILRSQGVPISTFASQHDPYFSSEPEPIRKLFTPSSPVAVPMKDALVLGSQTPQTPTEPGHDLLFYNQYDHLIMYPKKAYIYD